MKKLVAFDFDGTLIDSIADIACAVNHVRNVAGLPMLDLKEITRCVGDGALLLMERTIPADVMEKTKALEVFKAYYQEHPSVNTKLYNGVTEGLSRLFDAGCILCVVSNKPTELCFEVLKGFKIDCFFTEVIGGNSGFELKPAPDALLFLKEKYCTDINYMCGDHYTDLGSGTNAGFKRIFASYGFGDPRDEKYDFKADDFNEVCNIILTKF